MNGLVWLANIHKAAHMELLLQHCETSRSPVNSSSRIASHLIICVISVPFKPSPRYVEHDTLIWEYLNSSIHLAPYLEKKFRKIYEGEAYKFYRQRYE